MLNILNRKYLISFSYLAITVLGLVAFANIAVEYTPSIQLPSISISYSWGRTSPEVVEQELTRKVEGIVNQLRDVEKIRSVSSQGRSSVTVNFRKGAPIDFRVLELTEQLRRQEEIWPDAISTARITRSIPKDLEETENFMVYTMNGDYTPNELLEIAENNIRNPMLGQKGLVDVDIKGVEEAALIIDFDAERLNQLGLDPRMILNLIRTQLNIRSAGFIASQKGRYNVQIPTSFKSVESLKTLAIPVQGSEISIALEEVAKVHIGSFPPTQIRRINGLPSISISFVKEKGSDAFELAEWIEEKMLALTEQMNGKVILRKQSDATDELRKQFDSLKVQMLLSILVVFTIVILFIRQLRAPIIILGSIIFSILIGVCVLFYMGYSLNVLTLAGITVAVGMLIDNAVVVFEQINTQKMLVNRKERIRHCVKELPKAVVPVFASTLTTVGIFIPLLFALDELRAFLLPIAVALSLTLIASVLVAFSWIPYAYIWLIPASSGKKNQETKIPFNASKIAFFKRFSLRNNSSVKSLRRKKKKNGWLRFAFWRYKLRYLSLAILICCIGIPTFLLEETQFVPVEKQSTNMFGKRTVPTDSLPKYIRWYFSNRDEIDSWVGGLPYYFNKNISFSTPWGGLGAGEVIHVRLYGPQGTPLSEFDKAVKHFESIAEPYKDSFSYYEAQITEGRGATLRFEVKDSALYTPDPYQFLGEAMYLGARTGNLWCTVSGFQNSISTGLGGSFSAQRINVFGYEYEALKQFSLKLAARLKENRRVTNVDINSSYYSRSGEYKEYILEIDDEALAARAIPKNAFIGGIGIDLNPSFSFGKVLLEGKEVSLLGRNQYHRKVYVPEVLDRKRLAFSNLENQAQPQDRPQDRGSERTNEANLSLFSIADIGSITKKEALGSIRRENQEYQRTISFEYSGRSKRAQEYRDEVVENIAKPDGIRIEENNRLFSFYNDASYENLGLIALMSLISVWMIITALLESWKGSLEVLIVLPLCLISIMIGALVNEISFERGAIAGSLLCVGVVVNNAILIVHRKQALIKEGITGLRAMAYAYKEKMRPIAITTLTTIGGLIPLIFNQDDLFWQNLAIVVTWGLAGSTLLSLVYLSTGWRAVWRYA
jgi:multidrug efflux pump subunit AcrB